MGTDIVPFRHHGVVGRRKLISSSAASIIRTRVGGAVNAGLQEYVYQVATPDGVVVVTIILDDSGSARKYHRAIVRGLGEVIRLIQSESNDNATLTLKAMKAHVPWIVGLPIWMLEVPVKLPYIESGGTPLFRSSLEGLGLTLAMVAEIASRKVKVTSLTLIVTDDKGDTLSGIRASDVATVVRDMRSHGHIIRGLGVGDPLEYHAIFRSMGLEDDDVYDCDGDIQITGAFHRFALTANSRRKALTAA